MDMSGMDMGSSGDSSDFQLLATDGFNLSNMTDAMDFLHALLDDSELQPVDLAISRIFWYGIAIVISIATMINLYFIAISTSRFRAAKLKRRYPASPANPFTQAMATATAIIREATYSQYNLTQFSSAFKLPPMGVIYLLLAYLGFVIGLEYYHNFIPGAQHYQAFSLRATWLTVAQLPLLILLAGKNNLIGLLTGVSYERLNVFHRWVGRMIWLTATLHWAYQQYGWSQFGLHSLEKSTDICYPTGIAAWTILTWTNVSSMGPLRNWHYEFFVVQHILTFVGFIVAIMIHIPVTYARVYVYIPIGLYLFDRLVRSLRFSYNNSRIGRGTITSLPGNVSKIRVQSSRLARWKAGQHVHLSLPRFGILQSHPATILSTPSSHDGDLVFILKAHRGFTSRVRVSADSSSTALLDPKTEVTSSVSASDSGESATSEVQKHVALISGPYGYSHSDFAAFSSTLLIAGSTGVTFTLPILLGIAERAQTIALPLRHLSFVWIIKSSIWTSWIAEELESAVGSMSKAGITCEVNIFVTCDESMAGSDSDNSTAGPLAIGEKNEGCNCANTEGPCCCTADIEPTSPIRKSCCEKKSSVPQAPRQHDIRDFATIQSGRPALENMIWDNLDAAEGETGIAVCGPLALNMRCRRAVAGISDARGVHKGTGAQGVYLHVEGFGW